MQTREMAYLILTDIDKGGFANLLLDQYLNRSEYGLADKALITNIVYGTVKYQLRLDWIIEQLVRNTRKLEIGVRIVLRMSFYQLQFMDRIPPSAVTNEAVKIVRKHFHTGAAGLVNGVLRNYLRNPDSILWPHKEDDPVKYLQIIHSHPEWMIRRWLSRYGYEKTEQLCLFNNKPANLWLRTNTLRTNRADLLKILAAEGCTVEAGEYAPEAIRLIKSPGLSSLPSYKEGLFTIQDESSMLVAHVLSPQPGNKVYDVCAGLGGKTTHLAQIMDNRGSIIAGDIYEHKLKLIRQSAAQLGITIIETLLKNALNIGPEHHGVYDKVLVDAPCSGLGVLRRRPDARWKKTPEDILILARLQREILQQAVKTVRKGGRIIYSTCTIEAEENEELISKFVRDEATVKTFDLATVLPYKVKPIEKAQTIQGYRQYLPFSDQMEGFFIAGMQVS